MSKEQYEVQIAGYRICYHNFEELATLTCRWNSRVYGLGTENLEQAATQLRRISAPNHEVKCESGRTWLGFEFAVEDGNVIILVPTGDDRKSRRAVALSCGRFLSGTDTVHYLVKRFLEAAIADAERDDPRRTAAM